MINKGKGCISAIFNGSIPIGVIKHGLETVFNKAEEPVEPTQGYVTEGVIANYSGYDCEGGSTWVDSASGNNITMYNNPTFNSEIHGWVFGGGSTKQYGKGNISAPTGDYTIEIYGLVPDMSTYSKIAAFVGHTWSAYKGYGIGGVYTDSNNARTMCFFATANNSGKNFPMYLEGIWGANIKTKFVLRRNQADGIYNQYAKNINGDKTQNDTVSTAAITPYQQKIIIGSLKDASTSASDFCKGTMFAVRVYNRYLTDEEIAQNHAEDVRLYGE